MRHLYCIGAFTLAVIVGPLVFQQTPGIPPDNVDQFRPWVVEGDVLGAEGPVPGARVVANGPGPVPIAVTDDKGHYILKGQAPGNYVVNADKSGYGTKLSAYARQVTLLSGQRIERVNLHIGRESILSGRVVDSDKNTARGARVLALVKTFREGEPCFVSVGEATTDDLGEYRIAGLPEGRYYLALYPKALQFRQRAPNVSSEGRKPQRAAARTYYMNSASLDAATAIFLRPGENREGLDLVLGSTSTYCVFGTFAGAVTSGPGVSTQSLKLGELMPGGILVLARGNPISGEDFEICGVPPGSYSAEITVWGDTKRPGVRESARASFTLADRDVELGVLQSMPNARLQGQVSLPDQPSTEGLPEGISVVLRSKERPSFYLGEEMWGKVQRDGKFILPSLLSDDYVLRVAGLPRGFYLRSAEQAGRDALRDAIRPGAGELRIGLATDGSTVTGQAVNRENQPVADAVVMLAAKEASGGERIQSQQSDQQGQFRFDDSLAPGRYLMVALTGLYVGENQDPDLFRAHRSHATEVTLSSKESRAVTLTVRSVR